MVTSTLRLQGFDSYLLSCIVPLWVIPAELNFPKVALERKMHMLL